MIIDKYDELTFVPPNCIDVSGITVVSRVYLLPIIIKLN